MTIEEATALRDELEAKIGENRKGFPAKAENWTEQHWIELHNRLYGTGVWLPIDIVQNVSNGLSAILDASQHTV
jgi:hypothetical protein